MKRKAYFTAAARKAGVEARRRNNELRKKGLLPPRKGGKTGAKTAVNKTNGKEVSFPLDAVPMPEKKKYNYKAKAKAKPGNPALLERVLSLLEKLV